MSDYITQTKKAKKATLPPSLKVKYQIFLSHSSKDKKFVDMITFTSKLAGIRVYRFDHDIQPGIEFANKLKQNLKKSDALLVLLSESSQSSSYVREEIGMALMADKLIIPLVQEGLGIECLSILQGREYLPVDFNNPVESLSKLHNYLKRLYNKKQTEFNKNLVWALIFVLALYIAYKDNERINKGGKR